MDSNYIKFEKTYQERFEEYFQILRYYENNERLLTASDIRKAWCMYLEISMIPVGWNAYWKISKETCKDLNVLFPTVCVVTVDRIKLSKLIADVTIVFVEDGVPECFPPQVSDIPLKDLFPLNSQEDKSIDIQHVAEVFDQLRIFYNHLWRPWDLEKENENEDWLVYNLKPRLQLYYDIINGKLHTRSVEIISNLLKNSRKVYAEIEDLQKLNDDSGNVHNLAQLYIEFKVFKHKLDSWENSELRKVMNDKICEESTKSGVILVMPPVCSLMEYAEHVSKAAQVIPPSATVKKITTDLQKILASGIENDTVLLGPGSHCLTNNGGLINGGTLRGICKNTLAQITDAGSSNSCMFEFFGAESVLQNVAIEVGHSRDTIYVRQGHLNMRNVRMVCFRSNQSQGILLGKGACLTVDQCSFSGFDTAIVCLANSSIKLSHCSFARNRICVRERGETEIEVDSCNSDGRDGIIVDYFEEDFS